MAAKNGGKTILEKKVARRFYGYPTVQNFRRKISFHFRDKHVFVFNAKNEDGRQKWRENNFGEKLPVDCGTVDTLWVKIFVEIALSHSVSEINTLLDLAQTFKMAAKSGGKMIFAKNWTVDFADTL